MTNRSLQEPLHKIRSRINFPSEIVFGAIPMTHRLPAFNTPRERKEPGELPTELRIVDWMEEADKALTINNNQPHKYIPVSGTLENAIREAQQRKAEGNSSYYNSRKLVVLHDLLDRPWLAYLPKDNLTARDKEIEQFVKDQPSVTGLYITPPLQRFVDPSSRVPSGKKQYDLTLGAEKSLRIYAQHMNKRTAAWGLDDYLQRNDIQKLDYQQKIENTTDTWRTNIKKSFNELANRRNQLLLYMGNANASKAKELEKRMPRMNLFSPAEMLDFEERKLEEPKPLSVEIHNENKRFKSGLDPNPLEVQPLEKRVHYEETKPTGRGLVANPETWVSDTPARPLGGNSKMYWGSLNIPPELQQAAIRRGDPVVFEDIKPGLTLPGHPNERIMTYPSFQQIQVFPQNAQLTKSVLVHPQPSAPVSKPNYNPIMRDIGEQVVVRPSSLVNRPVVGNVEASISNMRAPNLAQVGMNTNMYDTMNHTRNEIWRMKQLDRSSAMAVPWQMPDTRPELIMTDFFERPDQMSMPQNPVTYMRQPVQLPEIFNERNIQEANERLASYEYQTEADAFMRAFQMEPVVPFRKPRIPQTRRPPREKGRGRPSSQRKQQQLAIANEPWNEQLQQEGLRIASELRATPNYPDVSMNPLVQTLPSSFDIRFNQPGTAPRHDVNQVAFHPMEDYEQEFFNQMAFNQKKRKELQRHGGTNLNTLIHDFENERAPVMPSASSEALGVTRRNPSRRRGARKAPGARGYQGSLQMIGSGGRPLALPPGTVGIPGARHFGEVTTSMIEDEIATQDQIDNLIASSRRERIRGRAQTSMEQVLREARIPSRSPYIEDELAELGDRLLPSARELILDPTMLRKDVAQRDALYWHNPDDMAEPSMRLQMSDIRGMIARNWRSVRDSIGGVFQGGKKRKQREQQELMEQRIESIMGVEDYDEMGRFKEARKRENEEIIRENIPDNMANFYAQSSRYVAGQRGNDDYYQQINLHRASLPIEENRSMREQLEEERLRREELWADVAPFGEGPTNSPAIEQARAAAVATLNQQQQLQAQRAAVGAVAVYGNIIDRIRGMENQLELEGEEQKIDPGLFGVANRYSLDPQRQFYIPTIDPVSGWGRNEIPMITQNDDIGRYGIQPSDDFLSNYDPQRITMREALGLTPTNAYNSLLNQSMVEQGIINVRRGNNTMNEELMGIHDQNRSMFEDPQAQMRAGWGSEPSRTESRTAGTMRFLDPHGLLANRVAQFERKYSNDPVPNYNLGRAAIANRGNTTLGVRDPVGQASKRWSSFLNEYSGEAREQELRRQQLQQSRLQGLSIGGSIPSSLNASVMVEPGSTSTIQQNLGESDEAEVEGGLQSASLSFPNTSDEIVPAVAAYTGALLANRIMGRGNQADRSFMNLTYSGIAEPVNAGMNRTVNVNAPAWSAEGEGAIAGISSIDIESDPIDTVDDFNIDLDDTVTNLASYPFMTNMISTVARARQSRHIPSINRGVRLQALQESRLTVPGKAHSLMREPIPILNYVPPLIRLYPKPKFNFRRQQRATMYLI